MRIAAAAILTTTFALVSCAPYADEPGTAPPASDCPVYESRDWQAWINAMPGPNSNPTLHIRGEVDMPTPGWSVELVAGPADRAQPPGLRFRLKTERPGGIVTQVITPTEVRYEAPTPYREIREIIIGCGDRTLVTIDEVTVAQ